MASCRTAPGSPSDRLRPPLTPMAAAPVRALPAGPGIAYEPKWDGWRGLIFTAGRQSKIYSRAGRDLTRYFPDLAAAAESLPDGCVLDGELVVWDPGTGRTSFTHLQQRITAGGRLQSLAAERPAYLACFDLLQDRTRPILGLPLSVRRSRLEAVLANSRSQFSLCPQTTDMTLAERWMADFAVAAIEGLVIKNEAGSYTPGLRGWQKLRRYDTTEAIVGGVIMGGRAPIGLLLGRYDAKGRLRYAGRTGRLSAATQHDPVLLSALDYVRSPVTHPWPQPLPAKWTGSFRDPQPLPYVQLRPQLVAEIEADTASDNGTFRHMTRFVRVRPDLSVDDVPLMPAREPASSA